MKKVWFILGSLILLMVIGAAFSTKQDDMQYRRFLMQDKTVEGKPGVLVVALGQPEHYDFEFFDRYMTQIFNAAFPPALKPVIMADKGTVLLDPDNSPRRKSSCRSSLIDCFGNEKNEEGEKYVRSRV